MHKRFDGDHVAVAIPDDDYNVEFDKYAGQQNGEYKEFEGLVLEQQELLFHREKVVSLDPKSYIGQTAVEAESGEAAHHYLKHLDAKVGHEIAGSVLDDAVDKHDGEKRRK